MFLLLIRNEIVWDFVDSKWLCLFTWAVLSFATGSM